MSYRVAVLGGGIAGLSAAWFLKKKGHEVKVFESSSRVGGWIKTTKQENFLFEEGPHSLRGGNNHPATLKLLQELDLLSSIVFPSSSANKRYIYSEKKLRCLPNRLWDIPFNSLMSGWWQALRKDWKQTPFKGEEESVANFFARHFGQKWVDLLVDPFISGIYAGNPEKISLKSCFPMLYQWDQETGSLLKSVLKKKKQKIEKSLLNDIVCFSFKEGMETLPRAIAKDLNECIHLNESIESISYTLEGIKVKLKKNREIVVDRVVSTLPANQLSKLFPDLPWNQLSYNSVSIVNLGYSSKVLDKEGFGYLIPSKEKSDLLGVIWDSSIFPQQNKEGETRLAVMLKSLFHKNDQEVIAIALAGISEQLKIDQKPQTILVTHAQSAIPQFHIGYEEWKEKISKEVTARIPGFYLAGSSFSGVSVHDCIAEGERIASFFL